MPRYTISTEIRQRCLVSAICQIWNCFTIYLKNTRRNLSRNWKLKTESWKLAVGTELWVMSIFAQSSRLIAHSILNVCWLLSVVRWLNLKKSRLNPDEIFFRVLEFYFKYLSSQLKNLLCHKIPFCALSTQWFSSGKYKNSAGIPLTTAALYACMPCVKQIL